MPGEARLEPGPSGSAPATPGWFVVNVAEAAWVTQPRFGASCGFEARDAARFAELGINIRVLAVGARAADWSEQGLHYPVSGLAARFNASVATETGNPREAYSDVEWPEPGRPDAPRLPWHERRT